MQTECARCRRAIDTVQGYKFGPNQYLCMPCYDQFKAERLAKAKQQHANPPAGKFGKEPGKPASEPPTASQNHKVQQPQTFRPRQQAAAPTTQQRPAAPPISPAASDRPASPPQPSAETCDVCKRPLGGFKFPLKGGKKACPECNEILREVAKSLILNVQCPHCGKEIQLSQD